MEKREELYNLYLREKEKELDEMIDKYFENITDEQLKFIHDIKIYYYNKGYEIAKLHKD